jgi:hypothetical protein
MMTKSAQINGVAAEFYSVYRKSFRGSSVLQASTGGFAKQVALLKTACRLRVHMPTRIKTAPGRHLNRENNVRH